MQFIMRKWGITRLLPTPVTCAVLVSMLLCIQSAWACTIPANCGAPILLYHHVSDKTPASTSISPDQFEQHMAFIDKHYTVIPLPELVSALQNKKPLPDNALAITFDDGYKNILQNGHPVLQKYRFPYTVFINPAEIGQRDDQLTWEEVDKMQSEGVLFANHTLDHLHMLNRAEGESEKQWLDRVWHNVTQAEAQIEQHTGTSLKYLAYPFGEYNQSLSAQLRKAGYVGFGQHSGAAGWYSDITALPRFPAAGPYAALSSLKTKMASLAMPVTHTTSSEPQRNGAAAPGKLTLTIEGEDVRLSQASCYFQGSQVNTTVQDQQLSVTLDKTLPVGRSRVNCTAPSTKHSGRYYWYSQPFFVADKNGNYPD